MNLNGHYRNIPGHRGLGMDDGHHLRTDGACEDQRDHLNEFLHDDLATSRSL